MCNELSMTPSEIVLSYRQAKDKRKQITILSELNACSKGSIIEILKANGVDGRQLPRTTSSTSSKEVTKPVRSTQKREKPKEDVLAYISNIRERRQQLIDEIRDIDATLATIAQQCTVNGDVK